jgi:hypothetical protein
MPSQWFRNAPVLTSSLGLWGEVLVICMQACFPVSSPWPSVLEFPCFLLKVKRYILYCYQAVDKVKPPERKLLGICIVIHDEQVRLTPGKV